MKEFNHTKHVELWNWLAENPGRFKDEWPGFDCEDDIPERCCYACEATYNGCIACPIDWGDCMGCCSSGMFEEWHDNVIKLKFYHESKNKEDLIRKVREAAISIADAPIKKDMEYKII